MCFHAFAQVGAVTVKQFSVKKDVHEMEELFWKMKVYVYRSILFGSTFNLILLYIFNSIFYKA